MNIALLPHDIRDINSVFAFLMMAGVVIAAVTVICLLGRHHHRGRKARKAEKSAQKNHQH